MTTTPDGGDDREVETITGDVLTFATRAEYDAFMVGFEWGDRYGTEKDWSDGYREGDLVDVEFDVESLTVRQRVAAGGEGEEEGDPEDDDGEEAEG